MNSVEKKQLTGDNEVVKEIKKLSSVDQINDYLNKISGIFTATHEKSVKNIIPVIVQKFEEIALKDLTDKSQHKNITIYLETIDHILGLSTIYGIDTKINEKIIKSIFQVPDQDVVEYIITSQNIQTFLPYFSKDFESYCLDVLYKKSLDIKKYIVEPININKISTILFNLTSIDPNNSIFNKIVAEIKDNILPTINDIFNQKNKNNSIGFFDLNQFSQIYLMIDSITGTNSVKQYYDILDENFFTKEGMNNILGDYDKSITKIEENYSLQKKYELSDSIIKEIQTSINNSFWMMEQIGGGKNIDNLIVQENNNTLEIKLGSDVFCMKIDSYNIYLYLKGDEDKFICLSGQSQLYELFEKFTPDQIKNTILKEGLSQQGKQNKITTFDLPKDEYIKHFVVTQKQYDSVIGGDILNQHILNKTLSQNYNISHEQISSDNPLDTLKTSIINDLKKGTKEFLIDFQVHGMITFLGYPGGYIRPSDLTGFFSKICSENPGIHITINTIACFGGGLLHGFGDFLVKYPQFKNNITLITQTDPNVPQNIGAIFGTEKQGKNSYSALFAVYFTQGLLQGMKYGEAAKYADDKIYIKLKQNNAKFLIGGEIVDTRRKNLNYSQIKQMNDAVA